MNLSHEGEILFIGISAPLIFVVLCVIVALVSARAARPKVARPSMVARVFSWLKQRHKVARRAKRMAAAAERRQRALDASAQTSSIVSMPPPTLYRIAKAHRVVARKNRRLVIVSDYPDGTSTSKKRTRKGHYRPLGTSPTGQAADQAFLDAASL